MSLTGNVARSPVYKAPVAARYDWTGCYAGVQAGGGVLNDLFVSNNTNNVFNNNVGGSSNAFGNATNGGGGLAGGQLGCNIQAGHIVFGLEGEAAASSLKNSFDSVTLGNLTLPQDATDRNRWNADLAVRAGVVLDRALIYGKVGVAEGQFALSQTFTNTIPSSGFANAGGTFNGLLLGAGIEYALAPNWSMRLEYNHIDYFGKTLHFNGDGVVFGGPFDQTEAARADIVKAGINYRFGGADLPGADRSRALLPAVAYNWTGCYAGVHGGGGVLNDSFVSSVLVSPTATSDSTTNGGGGLAGGQLGCNIQTGAIVFGFEGEAAWSGLKNSFDFAVPVFSQDITDRNRWSADLAVRAGVAVDRALIYGKVGVAEGRFDFTFNDSFGNSQTASGTLNGLLLGGGIEYALAPNWSAKLEYNHIDYLGKTLHFNASAFFGGPFDQTEAARADIVKAGINYRFGGADLPGADRSRALLPAPATNWTGCYAGVHGGGGVLNDPFVGSVFVQANGTSDPTTNGGGGLAGGQLGCNIQTGAIVFGFEGEAAWSGLKNSFDFAQTVVGFGPILQDLTDRNRWSADLAVRAGIAVDRALIYGKVGVAEGQFAFSKTQTAFPPPTGFANASGTLNGVLLGAGIEYAFAPNWSAKLEYNHIDYLAKTLHFNGDGVVFTPFDVSESAQANIVKAGINYRFGGANAVVAKY